jgi:hypothetical protein
VTAQETYAAMLRDEVAPALRQLGLKGSGQRYEFSSEDYWAILGFQKSKWSDAAEVAFTVNLTVASRLAWAEARATHPYLPERPGPTRTLYGADVDRRIWQTRIGLLLGGQTDRWWRVTPAQNTRALAVELVNLIRVRALPAMREQMRSS